MVIIKCDKCGKEIESIKNKFRLQRNLYLCNIELVFCRKCFKEICKYKQKKEQNFKKFVEE